MEQILNVIMNPRVLFSILILVGVVIVWIILNVLGKKYKNSEKSHGERASFVHIGSSLLKIVIVTAAILLLLQINGVNVTAMVAGLGLASAIIGLALQDFIKDVIMGLYIASEHFFAIGECVEYQGREGIITSLSVLTTKIGDLDDHSITTVCNRNLSEIRRIEPRMDIDIPLSYSESLKDVSAALCAICKKVASDERVESCDFIGTQSFEASSVLYRIRINCNPHDRADVRRMANLSIQEVLAEADIKIPFNQLDVHIDQ